MNASTLRKLATAVVLTAGLTTASGAFAIDDLRIIAPGQARRRLGPDGARPAGSRCKAGGIAKSVTVENVAGAGGTVGLAQLVDKEKGNGNVLMVNGLVMVGAILTNKSPVTLEQTTPIARLTGEYEVIVVPAASEHQDARPTWSAKLKADTGAVAWGGGSAGGTDHILAGLIAKAGGRRC